MAFGRVEVACVINLSSDVLLAALTAQDCAKGLDLERVDKFRLGLTRVALPLRVGLMIRT